MAQRTDWIPWARRGETSEILIVLFPGRPSQQVGREPGNKATKLLAMPVLQLHGVVPILCACLTMDFYKI